MEAPISSKRRIVITGMGVVAPNGVGLNDFEAALRAGRSGLAFIPELAELKFGCQLAGVPPITDEQIATCFTPLQLRNFNSDGIIYGVVAAMEAWQQAGLGQNQDEVDFDTGVIFGTGTSGIEKLKEAINLIDDLKVKRLGSNAVLQTMASGVSAFIAGAIGAGNQVSTNSSACATGAEALLMGYRHIQAGLASRMLVGSSCESGAYLWGGFDAMRVTDHKHNAEPSKASRPMSATAAGLVPGAGAGAFVLETLEAAKKRGATIFAEIIGGQINSGGQRSGGTLTAPNPIAVRRCIADALEDSGIEAGDIELINGHLTATVKDPDEVAAWVDSLKLSPDEFPYIQSTKSMIGHCLSASGAIELVATVLQMSKGFIHPSINCEDLHPAIAEMIPERTIPGVSIEKKINTAIKASFGFGDVNACVVLSRNNL